MNVYNNPLISEPSKPLPKHIGIIGAGTIGPDIAYYLKSAIPGLSLVLIDVVEDQLDKALERIEGYANKGMQRGKLTAEQAAGVMQNLNASTDYSALADCDWVIEAATENLDLKHRIFAQVESIVRQDTLITSNTSSIPAAWLFSKLEHPERCTVTHFFAPAFSNPVVEVIDWDGGNSENLEHLRWAFCATGKVPMITTDDVCFMLDRIFDNWCNEAAYLIDVASTSEIDSVALDYVHAGPFDVLNFANGNEIIPEVNTLQADEEGEHYRPAPYFRSVKTWKTAPRGKPIEVPPETAKRIRDRLLGIVFSQTVDIVDRSIGTSADLELGCRLAFAFKKGPLKLVHELGEAEVTRILERLDKERPGMPLPSQDIASYHDFRQYLLVDDLDGVKVITIRRPEALNALDDELNDEILSIIERYENDPHVKGFVLTGYGQRAFCAGADIGRFPEHLGDADGAAQYARDSSRLLRHIDGMTKPVVAAINGMALGGGLELAFRCHSIAAIDTAWLQLPEITLGILPGIGGMVVPYRRWPEAGRTFHDMLRFGKKLDARAGSKLGIIDELADDYADLIRCAVRKIDSLQGNAVKIADESVTIPSFDQVEPMTTDGRLLSSKVISIIENAVTEAALSPSLEAALEVGYLAFGKSACTEAAREGIESFQQRRQPDFSKTG
ncbi:MAG: 3-hydroxyacyl-CoA dehydrogenase/enoyl-CoA hydratase family protein [Gammaproteobacteria bacterium]|nr:3-hydroxyacyl-CoA dehydrogenase/enoyl-CoA hydratase family protein [Gammaproteobacteria bacterium]